jgi:hypothetical protein
MNDNPVLKHKSSKPELIELDGILPLAEHSDDRQFVTALGWPPTSAST